MHTVYKCFGFRFLPAWYVCRLSDCLGHGLIGQQHEFLYKFIGIFRLFEENIDRPSVGIYFETHLCTFEFYGTILKTPCAQLLGKRVQSRYFCRVIALAGLDDLLCLLVCETAVRTDYSGSYA